MSTVLARRVCRRPGPARHGSIINTSSISGVVGQVIVHMGYNAAKGAVRAMTKAAAVQFARDNMRQLGASGHAAADADFEDVSRPSGARCGHRCSADETRGTRGGGGVREPIPGLRRGGVHHWRGIAGGWRVFSAVTAPSNETLLQIHAEILSTLNGVRETDPSSYAQNVDAPQTEEDRHWAYYFSTYLPDPSPNLPVVDVLARDRIDRARDPSVRRLAEWPVSVNRAVL